jgi:hypothetical protein
LSDEIHFLYIAFVRDNNFSRCVNSAVHSNNKLVGKTSLAFFKEVIKGSFELLEDSCVLNKVGLHLWGNLLIELELFDN